MRRTVARFMLVIALVGPSRLSHTETVVADPCRGSPKGTTQTPAGMCIDGVLFNSVLRRLSAVEVKLGLASPTTLQGKLVR